MPVYVYRCKKCDSSFEETHTIDDRELPLQCSCPFCEELGEEGELFIDIQPCGLAFGGMPHKHPPEWFRDRLRAIKKRTPGNKINLV